jgi:hypothetical protein
LNPIRRSGESWIVLNKLHLLIAKRSGTVILFSRWGRVSRKLCSLSSALKESLESYFRILKVPEMFRLISRSVGNSGFTNRSDAREELAVTRNGNVNRTGPKWKLLRILYENSDTCRSFEVI